MENPPFPSIEGIKFKTMGGTRIGIRLGRILRIIPICCAFVLFTSLLVFVVLFSLDLSYPEKNYDERVIIGLFISSVVSSFVTFFLNYTQCIVISSSIIPNV
jgi:hypothetical protein